MKGRGKRKAGRTAELRKQARDSRTHGLMPYTLSLKDKLFQDPKRRALFGPILLVEIFKLGSHRATSVTHRFCIAHILVGLFGLCVADPTPCTVKHRAF